jgi:hypothetical protein
MNCLPQISFFVLLPSMSHPISGLDAPLVQLGRTFGSTMELRKVQHVYVAGCNSCTNGDA